MRQLPFARRRGSPFGSWLLSRALVTRICANRSGDSLCDRRCLENLHLTSTGFELEVEVVIPVVCNGMLVGWVDLDSVCGVGKVGYFHPVRDTARFFGMGWLAWLAAQ